LETNKMYNSDIDLWSKMDNKMFHLIKDMFPHQI
jgi:hypothetical protein